MSRYQDQVEKLSSYLIFMLILGCSSALSQTFDTEKFSFEQLTIKDGLTHNSVHCILQDRHGFMWFGTPNGLNRFDGYSFQLLSSLTGAVIQDEIRYIHCLYEDGKDNLWIGTEKSGIYILDRNSGKIRHLQDHETFSDIKGTWITKIFEDRNNNIWIGTLDKGVLVIRPDLSKVFHLSTVNSTLKSVQIMDFVEDIKGNVWIATSGTGIYKYNLQSGALSVHHSLDDQDDFEGFRKVMYSDTDRNCLWVGTEGSGLYKVLLDSFQVYQYKVNPGKNSISHERVRDVVAYTDSLLLIATDGGGLNVFNINSNQFTRIYTRGNYPGQLNTNAILNIFVDQHENIWLGTFNGGINVHKKAKTWFNSKWNEFTDIEILSENSILSMLEPIPGEIYFATDGGGLIAVNTADQNHIIFQAGLNPPYQVKSDVIKVLYLDDKSRTLLGFFNAGLDVLQQRNKSDPDIQILNELIPRNANIWALEQDQEGGLWIGTLGLGLYYYNPVSDSITIYTNTGKEGDLSDDHIMCIFQDSKDRIWIGTADGGLNLFLPDLNRFQVFKVTTNDLNSISSNAIRCIYEDYNHTLWIGTEGGGLNYMDTIGDFKHYGEEQGILSEDIMAISADEFGYIWFSTHENISRLDHSDEEVINFYFTGNESNQFNQNSVLRSSDKSIYFGGINGIVHVKPSQVKTNNIKPKVVITSLEINNEKVFPGTSDHQVMTKFIEDSKQIVLRPGDDVFSIEFASLDYTDPILVDYRYKMIGFDESWNYVSSDYRKVTYTNLSHGDYQFLVESSNADGQWNSEGTALDISILPTFWNTVWFKLIILFTIGAITFAVIRIIVIRREYILKQRVLKAEGEILKLNNEKLETEVSNKNARLMSTTLQMAHKNEILRKIKMQLDQWPSGSKENVYPKLRGISRSIDLELKNEDFWLQFNFFFNQVNTDYLKRLQAMHQNLTQNDIKLSALIKTGMNTKEIASILNISGRGVEKSRYRLKKKLNLNTGQDLNSYLLQF